MTIETKYNIGDEVWVNAYNKVQISKIRKIEIVQFTDKEITIDYKLDCGLYFDENFCFPTKEELLKSL